MSEFLPEQILSSIRTPSAPSPDDLAVLFSGKDSILCMRNNEIALPLIGDLPPELKPENWIRIGTLDGISCYGGAVAANLSGLTDLFTRPCRSVLVSGHPELWNAFSRTRELWFWLDQHVFCGRCRETLQASETDLALICPSCHVRYYPQIAPAVIVAITRKENREILLAHNRSFETGMYSLIAGFVEAGESVEHAVSREIMEETGIKVKNVRYLSSQTWPFPNSLMLAFSAEYESGTAVADGLELDDVNWFTADSLPKLPQTGSIARHVIETCFLGTADGGY